MIVTLRATLKRCRSQLLGAAAGLGPLAVLAPALPEARAVGRVALLVVLAAGLPRLVRFCSRTEDAINLATAMVTPARLLRPLPDALLVLALAGLLGAMPTLSGARLVEFAMAGAALQAAALHLAYQGKGDRIGNALTAVALEAAVATAVLAARNPVAGTAIVTLDGLFVLHLAVGGASDLRARFYPRGGIGVFFGTFNPVHKTHVAIIADALVRRRLEKVYIHPTTVPKLHRDALARGEIALTYEDGMRCYRPTSRADPNKAYFPTGRRFFEYAVRRALLRSAIADAELDPMVEVLDCPEVYEGGGFGAVLKAVRARAPGKPVHGLHGSDPGGMWVRDIFDSGGWIYPFPVKRRDGVSATAIREGTAGLTTPTIERFLAAMRNGQGFRFADGLKVGPDGRIVPAADPRAGVDQAAASAMTVSIV